MTGRVFVVGAGLAGLSAAVRLVEAGRKVALFDAAPGAGGRCRTFRDPRLERDIDNGNHLVLSGNRSTLGYLDRVGGSRQVRIMERAEFPFIDLGTGQRWTVRIDDGRVPWWMLRKDRRIPGTRLRDHAGMLALATAGPRRTVAQAIRDRGPLWHRFWEPLTLAVLNTTPERGQARLLWRALSETFVRGGARCRPVLAPGGWGRALIDPAIRWLNANGCPLRAEHTLRGIGLVDGRVSRLEFGAGSVDLGAQDSAVLALPPRRLAALFPDLPLPDDDAGIVNAHFRIPDAAALHGKPPVVGLLGGRGHWVFHRDDVVSLTISAANRLGEMGAAPDDLKAALWSEAAAALDLSGQPIAGRINKERRATFDQSPEGVARRPAARIGIANLVLAGDATQTGLPATIEGAIRSGETAARLVTRGR